MTKRNLVQQTNTKDNSGENNKQATTAADGNSQAWKTTKQEEMLMEKWSSSK